MTRSLRGSVVGNDEGFSVRVLGRAGLHYVEGDRAIEIDSEVLIGPVGMAVYSKSIKSWLPPHENESIDAAAKARIIENIRTAFRFSGSDIDVD